MKKIILFLLAIVSYQNCFAQVTLDSAFVHHQIVAGFDSSTFIFEGEVLSLRSYWNSSYTYIYSSATVRVNQSWKDYQGRPL